MKFLIHANAPWVSTGYGVQCALLMERLQAEGHDVACSSTYGQQGAMSRWKGMTVYPAGYEVNGNDVIHNHALHWFDGDQEGGWIIPILDVWCLVNPLLADFNVAAWTPVDHFPVPKDVLAFFHRTDAVPIAMSRYGELQLVNAGLNPVYIPLAVDTKQMQPTPTLMTSRGSVTCRELLNIPEDAFVVGMVAMNKGWSIDRKGFNEALRAFGMFWKDHQEAILYLHTEQFGAAEGINLVELAVHAAVPEHAIRWVDQYAYRLGMPPEMMAATYTAMDVLLAPSHGEGFCVPLVESQACGTPVIATDFSAQAELVGAGWKISGQPQWNPPQHASYIVPYVEHVLELLETAYRADLKAMAPLAREFALQYDADRVFEEHWKPFLASLEPVDAVLPLDREPIPESRGAVAVVVPAMRRPQNVAPLVESLQRCEPGANVYFVCDPEDAGEIAAVEAAGAHLIISKRGHTYAAKANVALDNTDEPWLFICGDDVRFHPGWLDEARTLSDRFDVIGTNDTAGQVKNPEVAAGRHADHFFVRRAYADTYGASLDGPNTLAPECYQHWWVDKEIVGLAKARGVFAPCLASVVEHLHPGYDGKPRDDVYLKAVEHADADQAVFMSRLPLIEMQRVGRGKR